MDGAPVESQDLEQLLAAAWEANHGEPPGVLHTDLEKLAPLFGQTSPAKIRDGLDAAGSAQPAAALVDHPLSVVEVIADTVLVTPEGRVLLESLRASLAKDPLAHWPPSELVDVYREWSRQKLKQVADRRDGRTPLEATSIAAGVTVWLAQALADDSALSLPAIDDSVSQALRRGLADFAETLTGRRPRANELFVHHPLRHARERLGPGNLVQKKSSDKVQVWLTNPERALELLTDEARRKGAETEIVDAFLRLRDFLTSEAQLAELSTRGWLAAGEVQREVRAALAD